MYEVQQMFYCLPHMLLEFCRTGKYPDPPHEWSMEIPRGWVLKKSLELNWNFQRGGGSNQKNHPWGGGGYGYFLEPHVISSDNYKKRLHNTQLVNKLITERHVI